MTERPDDPRDAGDPDEEPSATDPLDLGFDDLLGDEFSDIRDLPDEDFRPLLPPDDRVWRHPSELAMSEPQSRRGSPVAIAIGSGILGALLAVATVLYVSEPNTETVVERHLEPRIVDADFRPSGMPDVVGIAKATTPGIVRLSIGGASVETELGSGSGVMFRDNGYVLTNAHVVQGLDELTVVMSDGTAIDAHVVGADSYTDVAVVKADVEDAATVLLSTAERPEVGEWAVAIGSPLGLSGGPSVTLGVISAIGREIMTDDQDTLRDLIQTDAPIAPGSSGGALVGAQGGVIGITTAIAVSEVGAEGVGFAIPIDLAHDVAMELIEKGRVDHPWIGIRGRPASPEALEGAELEGGVLIVEAIDDGPADIAGVAEGDLLFELNHSPVNDMSELIVGLRDYDVGDAVDLTVHRDGEVQVIPVQLGIRPPSAD